MRKSIYNMKSRCGRDMTTKWSSESDFVHTKNAKDIHAALFQEQNSFTRLTIVYTQ